MTTLKTLTEAFREAGQFGGLRATCPHCGCASVFTALGGSQIAGDARAKAGGPPVLIVRCGRCSGCDSIVIGICTGEANPILIYPLDVPADRAPADIDPGIKQFYDEARAILTRSPSGAAMLARSCLQQIIRAKLGINCKRLQDEVQQAMDHRAISGPTREVLDHIREFGNWAAHEEVDLARTVMPVGLEEARHTLDVLEMLFDDLYTKPQRATAIKSRIDERKNAKKKV